MAKIAENNNKIPMTIYAGYANSIWTQGYKWIFNVGPTASEYSQAFVALVKSLPGKPKVGLIHEDGLWAKAVIRGDGKTWPSKRVWISKWSTGVYPADSKDVSASVSKVIAAGYPIIGTVSHVRNHLLVTRTILEMGAANKFKMIYVQTQPVQESIICQEFNPKQIQGVVGTSVWASSIKTYFNKEFQTEYKKVTVRTPIPGCPRLSGSPGRRPCWKPSRRLAMWTGRKCARRSLKSPSRP